MTLTPLDLVVTFLVGCGGGWLTAFVLTVVRGRSSTKRRSLNALVEFGTIENEPLERRAQRLLDWLLPKFHSRDAAVDSLFFVYPDATDRNIRCSIAAALFVLQDTEHPDYIRVPSMSRGKSR